MNHNRSFHPRSCILIWCLASVCFAVTVIACIVGGLEFHRLRGIDRTMLALAAAAVAGAAAALLGLHRSARRAGLRWTAGVLPVMLVLAGFGSALVFAPELHRARSGATNNGEFAEVAALWRIDLAAEGKPIPLLFEMMLDGMLPDRSFTCFYALAGPDDYHIGQYSYADLLRGRVTRAELRAEAERVGLLDQAWERAGPYVVCRDAAALRSQEPVVVAYAMGTYDQFVNCPVVASNRQRACRLDEEESQAMVSEWIENA